MREKFIYITLAATLVAEALFGVANCGVLTRKAEAEIKPKQAFVVDSEEKEDILSQIFCKSNLEKKVEFDDKTKIFKVPRYRISNNRCSEYSQRVAKEFYGKDFERGNAWDLGRENKIIKELEYTDHLIELAKDGTLRPGMIVGTLNPPSHYNRKGRKYTHVVLYTGKNTEGEMEFVHQFGRIQEKINYEELHQRGLEPIEIIDENPAHKNF